MPITDPDNPGYTKEEAQRDAKSILDAVAYAIGQRITYLENLIGNKSDSSTVNVAIDGVTLNGQRVSVVKSLITDLETAKRNFESRTVPSTVTNQQSLQRFTDDVLKVYLENTIATTGSADATLLNRMESYLNGLIDKNRANFVSTASGITTEPEAETPPATTGWTNVRDFLNDHFKIATGNPNAVLTDSQITEVMKVATGQTSPSVNMNIDYFMGRVNAPGTTRFTDMMSLLQGFGGAAPEKPAGSGWSNVRDFLNDHFKMATGNPNAVLTDSQITEVMKVATGQTSPTVNMDIDYFLSRLNATDANRFASMMNSLKNTPVLSQSDGSIITPEQYVQNLYAQLTTREGENGETISGQLTEEELKVVLELFSDPTASSSIDGLTNHLTSVAKGKNELPPPLELTQQTFIDIYKNMTGQVLSGNLATQYLNEARALPGEITRNQQIVEFLTPKAAENGHSIIGDGTAEMLSHEQFLKNLYSMLTSGNTEGYLWPADFPNLLGEFPNPQDPQVYQTLMNRLYGIAKERGVLTADPLNFGGGGGGGEDSAPGTGGGSTPTNSTTTRRLRLIRGDGGPAGANQLRNNGNAVFLVSSTGELFHVTEQLANELRESGDWYEPEVRPQAEVNGMALRASLNHTAELGILNVPPAGDYLLVRGMGPSLSNGQILGNGDAVFAIDKQGNKFHVTETVANQMMANNTWREPALLAQDTVDGMSLDGALTNASGGTTTTLSLALGTPVVGSPTSAVAPGVTAPLTSPVTPATPATPASGGGTTNPTAGFTFSLVRGTGPNLGTTQLKGNGAAVYAVLSDGTKLHVTEAMARTLVENNRWSEPRIINQNELDSTQPVGTLTDLNGGRGPLTIQFEAAGSMPTPTNPTTPATPAVPATPTTGGASGGTPTPTNPATPATPAGPSAGAKQQVSDLFYQYTGRAPSESETARFASMIDGGNLGSARNEIAWTQDAVNYRWSAIQDAFRQYVGRDATWEDQNIHGPRLVNGLTIEQLQIELANSQEARDRQSATVAGISDPAMAMYSEAINNIYRELVGREASADEIRMHSASLYNGSVNLDGLRNDIYWSTEARNYRGDYVPTTPSPVSTPVVAPPVAAPAPDPVLVHGQTIRQLYNQYLGRNAEANEVAFWAPRMANGEDVRALISADVHAVAYREQLVRETFKLYVLRDADANDMAHHAGMLARGEKTPEQFRLEIANAGEAVQKQSAVWAGLSPAAQAMYSEAINNIFMRVAGRAATQDDIRIHTAGLVTGATDLGRLEQNIAGAIQSGGAYVKTGQVLGASTDSPSVSFGSGASTSTTAKPEIIGEASNSSDDNAIWVTDANGERRDISGLSWDERADVQKHIVEGGGTFGQLDQVKDIYASGDPTAIDNWERFSQSGKYSPSTPWGATYQSVVKDGYSHELAAAWADGTHADNMKQATTPVNGVVGTAAVSTNGPNMFGIN